jgi:2,3-bisphosphoglycerate-independent phosphoglycerate mutase
VSFDAAPDMKARAITARACEAIASGRFDHVRLNLANGDMVGHTGNFDATVRAVETVDACLAELEAAAKAAGGVLLVTADHGNADEMYELDKKGAPVIVDGRRKPRTAHSLNPVPFVLADFSGQWALDAEACRGAGIASIGGTVLALAGIALPEGYLPALVKRA